MAVYTHCTDEDIAGFLEHYALGKLVEAKPIAEGVENSNYLLITEQSGQQKRYILTLYEKRVDAADLPFFLNLMAHLVNKGRNCPLPIPAQDGEPLRTLNGRPAALFSFLNGQSAAPIETVHLQELGAELARLHLAVSDFNGQRVNPLSPPHLGALYQKVSTHLNKLAPDLEQQLGRDLEAFQQWPQLALPQGIIHADLFPDNVFFTGDALSGVIDFYFACTDYFAYDLAICLNAWCFEKNGDFNIEKARALLEHYHAIKPLTETERQEFPLLARGAAIRFLLTRSHDWFFPVEGAVVTPHDPMEYVRKWQFHIQVTHYKEYGL